jgi:hypothetical protein
MPDTRPPPARRHDLDVTRELIVASLFIFHTARIFDAFPFYVKNEPAVYALSFIVVLVVFWGMPLMFVIAGFAIRRSLQQRTVAGFVRERLLRLLVPFITGLLLLAPPQVYYRLCTDPAYRESFIRFYPRFFDITFRPDFPWFFGADPGTRLFHPAHLWFLYILLVFTLLLLPLFRWLNGPAGRRRIGILAARSSRPWAILLPALPVGLTEAALGTNLSGGWNQSAYLVFLLCGFLLAADARFWHSLRSYRKSALALAVSASAGSLVWLSMLAAAPGADPLQDYDMGSVTLRFIKGIIGWAWLVAILGFMEHARLSRQAAGPSAGSDREPRRATGIRARLAGLERYAREAVLPVYLLHQTVIVIIGFHVVQWPLGAALKFTVICLGSLTVTLFIYEVVIRHVRLMRFCFGMKPPAV